MVFGMTSDDPAAHGYLAFTGNPDAKPIFEYQVDADGAEWLRQVDQSEGFGNWCPLIWTA